MIIVDGLEPIAGRKIQFDAAAAAAAWSAPALTRDTRPWRGHGDTGLEVSTNLREVSQCLVKRLNLLRTY